MEICFLPWLVHPCDFTWTLNLFYFYPFMRILLLVPFLILPFWRLPVWISFKIMPTSECFFFSHISICLYLNLYMQAYLCINTDIGIHIDIHLSLVLGLQYQHYHIFCMDSSFKRLTRLSSMIFKMYPCPFIIFLWQQKEVQNPHLSSKT